MTTPDSPVASSAPTTAARQAGTLRARAASSSWWLQGALLLAGAAQMIIISALVSADPLAATWWSLLLAIAPAPLAAAAAFGPAPVNRLATAACLLVLVAGIAGGIVHIALLFVPALLVLAVGGVRLWREGRAPAGQAAEVSLPPRFSGWPGGGRRPRRAWPGTAW